ncbi:alpha/beta fold hydrolase [Paenarthrobacter ureafaciens]|uniref:Alpha/beta hydrolase n=1 Tax=Paenarthrobacter ureafaciens TaxID=37931 RepID=A0AAX3EE00_PAEUR|nr:MULTISPECIES: alpha/beta fold hydrolase [Paenarthrobacter]BCW84777.1 hydrolase [Arthrobacter sp. NicSoilE8]MDO5865298.1 alpha/beta hydrolase [Paenarthrobacter sp. SD-2]MDO5876375.1 alpha/beta hydrolase [Paenarthrobacter sp. SD-1]MEC3850260.1 alpha/beta fold hydrolase [Paenarthrobacter ureafaciens]NWL25894.1 alpha/beta fold hydrolase [Paenarthrobacter ureafaciens]
MMTGRHTVEQQRHTVEGTDPGLFVEVHEPANDAGLRPVLLIHGFSSSSKLNWVDSGWIATLQGAGRRVITVDLPGHGRSHAPEDLDSYTPSRIRADLLQMVYDAGARPLQDGNPASGLDIIGYSLGSRLAWEFAATQPDLVHRVVLGGPSAADPLAAFDLAAAQRYLADGTPIQDESTAGLLKMAQLIPSNNLFAMLSLIEAIKGEPFDPAEAAPHMPLLLVAGEKDERAGTMPVLAEIAGKRGAMVETLVVPGRTHTNVVTSRAFKEAAVEFLAV